MIVIRHAQNLYTVGGLALHRIRHGIMPGMQPMQIHQEVVKNDTVEVSLVRVRAERVEKQNESVRNF
jgi:hypothetical protein